MEKTCTYEKNGSICGKSTTAGKSLCKNCYNSYKQKKYRKSKREKLNSKSIPNVRNELDLYDLPEYKELRKEEKLWEKARGVKLDREEFPIGICLAKSVSNYSEKDILYLSN
jgi:hypothetical protein